MCIITHRYMPTALTDIELKRCPLHVLLVPGVAMANFGQLPPELLASYMLLARSVLDVRSLHAHCTYWHRTEKVSLTCPTGARCCPVQLWSTAPLSYLPVTCDWHVLSWMWDRYMPTALTDIELERCPLHVLLVPGVAMANFGQLPPWVTCQLHVTGTVPSGGVADSKDITSLQHQPDIHWNLWGAGPTDVSCLQHVTSMWQTPDFWILNLRFMSPTSSNKKYKQHVPLLPVLHACSISKGARRSSISESDMAWLAGITSSWILMTFFGTLSKSIFQKGPGHSGGGGGRVRIV